MPLRSALLLVLLLGALSPDRAAHAQSPTPVERQAPAATSGTPDGQDIARAVERVKADPNMGGIRTRRTLKWNREPQKRERWSFSWLTSLFRFLAQSGRVLMWGAVLILAALLVGYLVRMGGGDAALRDGGTFVTPTHVRDLDIRPESLPPDIGAAARALWDSGQHRAALALLYRGLLSRLAHVHHVPIRDSTTEGDCLTLAVQHLDESQHQYSARLVRVWQRAVYGGAEAEPSVVYELCDRFAAALGPNSPTVADARGTA